MFEVNTLFSFIVFCYFEKEKLFVFLFSIDGFLSTFAAEIILNSKWTTIIVRIKIRTEAFRD